MFSTELRKKREARGLSLRDVEEKTGIPNPVLSRYEHGIGVFAMGVKNAFSLSKLFDWDISEMIKKMHAEAKKSAGTKTERRR